MKYVRFNPAIGRVRDENSDFAFIITGAFRQTIPAIVTGIGLRTPSFSRPLLLRDIAASLSFRVEGNASGD